MEYVESIRNAEDVNRVVDYLHRWNPMYSLLFLTGIHTGLRISDLLRLTAADVRGSHLVMRTKKTGARVRIPISSRLRRHLEPHIAKMHDRDVLFRSREGWNKPITRSRAYQVLNQAAKACGLAHIGTHSLRKTFGWHLYQKTGDVAILQELLGHQHPSVTLRYIGVVDADIDDVMGTFSIG